MIYQAYPSFLVSLKDNIKEVKVFDSNSPPEDCELMIFTGGADVSPYLYREDNTSSYSNPNRDVVEMKAYNFARKNNIPIFGICRGLQFINVMKGGTLHQQIPNEHPVEHPIYWRRDVNNISQLVSVNSYHHQGIKRLGKDLEIIGYLGNIPEVVIGDKIFLTQYHPEFVCCRITFESVFSYLGVNHDRLLSM